MAGSSCLFLQTIIFFILKNTCLFIFGCVGSWLWSVGSFLGANLSKQSKNFCCREVLTREQRRNIQERLWPHWWCNQTLIFSLVVACRLSCGAVCGILVPWPGMEPVSPALAGRFPTTGPPEGFLQPIFTCFGWNMWRKSGLAQIRSWKW